MKAATYTKYGSPDVLGIEDIPTPVPTGEEVLIKVHATTVSSGDWRARSLKAPPGFGLIMRLVFGVFGPRQKVLGTELSGVIVATGDQVSKFSVGDKVVAYLGAAMGAHAEFVVVQQDKTIAHKPANLSFEQSAAIAFGGDTALNFLRDKGQIKRGDRVLIVGASGATGSAAVQLAKYFGAHVTGVCSAGNFDLVRSLGADELIDYAVHDFTKNGLQYDLIVDTVGTAPWKRAKSSLKPTGRLLVISGSLWDMVSAAFVSRRNGRKLVPGVADGSPENLRFLIELAKAGDFKPVVEGCYPFDQIAQAHSRVDSGHKRGSVVVSIIPSHKSGAAAA